MKLARVKGLVHPLDAIKVYEDHTPYEWRLQECLAAVDPWGDDRADLRAAVHTINTMPLSEGDNVDEIFERLRNYVTTDSEDDIYDEDALAAVRDAQCPT
jgi:hypothetical protein